jgi:hypothetical protein
MLLNEDLRRHAGKFYGKYSAEVAANEDTQNLGRIHVRVPSVFQSNTPVRARPCFTSGHFFVPPVGAKVWVEFEAGDTRYPLWVGTFYPADAAPQPAAQNPPDTRVIHTPSGHTIELWDKEGEEKILIKHKDASFIELDKDGGVRVSDKNGAVVELKGDTVRLTASKVIVAASKVELGDGASEPTVLGKTFAGMWSTFITHTHATAVGPSGPPVPPALSLDAMMALTTAVVAK